jgi:hypothetical protein
MSSGIELTVKGHPLKGRPLTPGFNPEHKLKIIKIKEILNIKLDGD